MIQEQYKLIIDNKRNKYFYKIIDKEIAGIVLTGIEVKALRKKNCNMTGSYITFHRSIPILKNFFLLQKKDFSLLLTKQQIKKMIKRTTKENLTCIIDSIIEKHGLIKIVIALASRTKQRKIKSHKRNQYTHILDNFY